MKEVQRTFLMIKPDGIKRGLVGEIICRFERKGLKLLAMRMLWIDRPFAEKHYAIHKGKFFYEELINYITSGPVVAMVWEGINSIDHSRRVIGATNPMDAAPGSIRGEFAVTTQKNMIHGSDSPETSEKEIKLWFPDGVVEYPLPTDDWL